MGGPQHMPEFASALCLAVLAYVAFWLGLITVKGIQEMFKDNRPATNNEPSEPTSPPRDLALQNQQLMEIIQQAQEAQEQRRLSQQPGPIWQNHRLWEEAFRHRNATDELTNLPRQDFQRDTDSDETDQPMAWRFEGGRRYQQR